MLLVIGEQYHGMIEVFLMEKWLGHKKHPLGRRMA